MATNQTEYMRELMRHRRALKRGEVYDPATYARRGAGPRLQAFSPPNEQHPVRWWRGLMWRTANPPARWLAYLVSINYASYVYLEAGHCHRCGHVTDQPICWICKLEVER